MKVFVVEDSVHVRERLLDIVRDIEGADVVGDAASCDDAVKGIVDARPDVVILDIRLAGQGSGIDVLRRVGPQLPSLKAIMLSNYATPHHVKASVGAGAEYFLDKTLHFECIGAILRKFLSECGIAT